MWRYGKHWEASICKAKQSDFERVQNSFLQGELHQNNQLTYSDALRDVDQSNLNLVHHHCIHYMNKVTEMQHSNYHSTTNHCKILSFRLAQNIHKWFEKWDAFVHNLLQITAINMCIIGIELLLVSTLKSMRNKGKE